MGGCNRGPPPVPAVPCVQQMHICGWTHTTRMHACMHAQTHTHAQPVPNASRHAHFRETSLHLSPTPSLPAGMMWRPPGQRIPHVNSGRSRSMHAACMPVQLTQPPRGAGVPRRECCGCPAAGHTAAARKRIRTATRVRPIRVRPGCGRVRPGRSRGAGRPGTKRRVPRCAAVELRGALGQRHAAPCCADVHAARLRGPPSRPAPPEDAWHPPRRGGDAVEHLLQRRWCGRPGPCGAVCAARVWRSSSGQLNRGCHEVLIL